MIPTNFFISLKASLFGCWIPIVLLMCIQRAVDTSWYTKKDKTFANWAFLSYGKAPLDKAVTGGIYRISRNPMYTSFIIGVIGATVATASLWLDFIR